MSDRTDEPVLDGADVREFLKIYLPVTLLVIAGFALAWRFVDPAPPGRIVIATGAPGGSYATFGARYREILAESGIDLRVLHTAGAGENLELLVSDDSGVDVALVQGGVGDAFGAPQLVSLGAVAYEPLWVFVRSAETPTHLSALKGRRLAIGAPGSGTRVLARILLVENGLHAGNTTLLPIGGTAAIGALEDGRADAAFFVSAEPTPELRRLARQPGIRLMHFDRAEAYTRLFRYLSAVELPRGALGLEDDLPPRDMTLVAPAAALVVRRSLHPALVDMLLGAATEVHQPGGLFAPAGTFPSPKYLDFPLSDDARRYFRSGPTFLRRVLPFWAAVMTERFVIMLVPLVTLLIPFFKLAPPAYRWGVRRKIYRWYRQLWEIEEDLRVARDENDRRRIRERLDDMQAHVGEVRVPLAYAEDLYHLRLHIAFVKGLAA